MFLFRKNTIANNLAPRSNANPSFYFRKFKPLDHRLSYTHLQPHADNEHHFECDKCHSTSFVKLTTLRTHNHESHALLCPRCPGTLAKETLSYA
jgi:ribosomal protein S27AE